MTVGNEPSTPSRQVYGEIMDRAAMTALIDRASSGDDAAFGELALAVQDELFRFALAQGLQWADAAEATQESLLRACAGRRGWKRGSNAMAWLCGIAMNVVREVHRRRRRAARTNQNYDAAAGNAAADIAGEGWGQEDLKQLREAIEGLPPRQREAVACRYLRRMSIRETAQTMGCAEGTVKSAVSAALERLRVVCEELQ